MTRAAALQSLASFTEAHLDALDRQRAAITRACQTTPLQIRAFALEQAQGLARQLQTDHGATVHLLTAPPRMTLLDVTATHRDGGLDLIRAWCARARIAATRAQLKKDLTDGHRNRSQKKEKT